MLQESANVVGSAYSLVDLNELCQIANVADETQRQLFERPLAAVTLALPQRKRFPRLQRTPFESGEIHAPERNSTVTLPWASVPE